MDISLDISLDFVCMKRFIFKNNVLHALQLMMTLFEIQYDWRKKEPVAMKANIIHFWCVESELIIKNEFHKWTSELGCIWHIFRKLGYFWLFLANPDIQVTVNITVNKTQFFAAAGCCQCWSAWKEPNIPKMCQMHPNSDVQLWNNFWL